MHLVDKPDRFPHYCAVTGRAEDPEGFVDTGVDLPGIDPRIYVSHAGFNALCDHFHGATPERTRELENELHRISTVNAALTEQLADADRELDGIAFLKGRGYQPSKRVGRPRKTTDIEPLEAA